MFSSNASETYFKTKVRHKQKMVQGRASGSFSCVGKCFIFSAYFMREHPKRCQDGMTTGNVSPSGV